MLDKTFVELFAGVGLIGRALQTSGWKCVLANDNCPNKAKLWRANHKECQDDTFKLADVSQLSASDLARGTLLTASFPCTDFSLTGSRKGFDGKHSNLILGVLEMLKECAQNPRILLLENVPSMLTVNNQRHLQTLFAAMKAAGFGKVDMRVIDAQHFTAQSRRRLFIVAMRSHTVETTGFVPNVCETIPHTVVAAIKRNNEVCSWMNLHVPKLPDKSLRVMADHITNVATSWFEGNRKKRMIEMIPDAHLEYALGPGRRYKHFALSASNRYGVMKNEIMKAGKCHCLRTPAGGSSVIRVLTVSDNEEGDEDWETSLMVRNLTPSEYASLQGVPNFVFGDTSSTTGYKAMGDAVCVPVVEFIANNVLERVFKACETEIQCSSIVRAI